MELKVSITTEDFKNALQYHNSEECPLYYALKRMYPESKVNAYLDNVRIDGVYWDIPEEWGNTWNPKYTWRWIDEKIAQAKAGQEIETVELLLTPSTKTDEPDIFVFDSEGGLD